MSAETAPAEQQPEQTVREAVRHGSRWLHRHPTEDQVRTWFGQQHLHKELVTLAGDDGDAHAPYIGGVVVIGAVDKPKVTKVKQNGDTYTVEVEVATFTPYVKVDTRVAYFWDLVRAMNEVANDDKYVGTIDPVKVPVIRNENSPYYNEHLPEGFTFHAVKEDQADKVTRYIIATFEAAIYERQSYARLLNGSRELPILKGRGSKQVGVKKKYADDNAVMKAETGAVGRALGLAGILVVGTGVATAEDMQEELASRGNPTTAEGESAPPPAVVVHSPMPADQPEGATVTQQTMGAGVPAENDQEQKDADYRTRALELQRELESKHPEAWAAYREWWAGRGFGPLSDLNGPALQGAVIKLERDLESARSGAAGA